MSDQSQPLVQLPGSERAPLAEVQAGRQLDTSERAELTLVLRRRADIPAEIVEGPTVLTRDELAERYGADPADVDLVRQRLPATAWRSPRSIRPPAGSRWRAPWASCPARSA